MHPSPLQGNLLIDDLIVMECNEEMIEFLVLTKPEKYDSDEVRFMKTIEYPCEFFIFIRNLLYIFFLAFKCTCEIKLPLQAWLINQPKSSVNMYFLNGSSFNSQDMPQEIEVKLVSETNPEDRLKKLIAKGHLEEAEVGSVICYFV